jgi:hypothetical protein
MSKTARFVEADQSDLPCPVPFAKRFPFSLDPNHIYKPRRLVPKGHIAIVTDVGNGMRWTRQRLSARRDGRAGFGL